MENPSGSVRKVTKEVSNILGNGVWSFIYHDYETLINDCLEAIKQDPSLPEPYNRIALMYEDTGDIPKAIEFFLLEAHLRPKNIELWNKIATLAMEIGNKHQAAYCFQRILKAEPKNFDAAMFRASLLFELNEKQKAFETLEPFIDDVSDDVEAAYTLATFFFSVNQDKSAIKTMEFCIKLQPLNLNFANLLCDVYLRSEDWKNILLTIKNLSIQICQSKHELPPASTPYSLILPIDLTVREGIALLHLSHTHPAQKCHDQLIRVSSTEYADLYYMFASHCMETDHISLALDLLLLLATNEQYATSQVYVWLGECYSELNEVQKSINNYTIALSLDPSLLSVRMTLSQLYRSQGDTQNALRVISEHTGSHPLVTTFGQQQNSLTEAKDALVYKTQTDIAYALEQAELFFAQSDFDSFLSVSTSLLTQFFVFGKKRRHYYKLKANLPRQRRRRITKKQTTKKSQRKKNQKRKTFQRDDSSQEEQSRLNDSLNNDSDFFSPSDSVSSFGMEQNDKFLGDISSDEDRNFIPTLQAEDSMFEKLQTPQEEDEESKEDVEQNELVKDEPERVETQHSEIDPEIPSVQPAVSAPPSDNSPSPQPPQDSSIISSIVEQRALRTFVKRAKQPKPSSRKGPLGNLSKSTVFTLVTRSLFVYLLKGEVTEAIDLYRQANLTTALYHTSALLNVFLLDMCATLYNHPRSMPALVSSSAFARATSSIAHYLLKLLNVERQNNPRVAIDENVSLVLPYATPQNKKNIFLITLQIYGLTHAKLNYPTQIGKIIKRLALVMPVDPVLQMMTGNEFFFGNSMATALAHYETAQRIIQALHARGLAEKTGDPYIQLLISLCYLFFSLNKSVTDRHFLVLKAFASFQTYATLRNNPHESEYNTARGYHHLSLFHLAVPHYLKCLSLPPKDKEDPPVVPPPVIDPNIGPEIDSLITMSNDFEQRISLLDDPDLTEHDIGLKRDAAYNLASIAIHSMEKDAARAFLWEHIVIE
ncbi:putative General transcription factor 3C polypeptide 3 [Blattamonas nauphoetae]|uniref:General transcription factor 3C polypeptide 3 n=1 Tax=Blattamonas nauphoetae TaxID=2049346 RepID=A0ABQ9XGV5_9EUKA|nr:putative General transcription factor 3C polypeptide 3 [Blattamonas nauphoetae]